MDGVVGVMIGQIRFSLNNAANYFISQAGYLFNSTPEIRSLNFLKMEYVEQIVNACYSIIEVSEKKMVRNKNRITEKAVIFLSI